MPEGVEPAPWDREMSRHGYVPESRLVAAVEPHRLSMSGEVVARKPHNHDISRALGLDVAPAKLVLRRRRFSGEHPPPACANLQNGEHGGERLFRARGALGDAGEPIDARDLPATPFRCAFCRSCVPGRRCGVARRRVSGEHPPPASANLRKRRARA